MLVDDELLDAAELVQGPRESRISVKPPPLPVPPPLPAAGLTHSGPPPLPTADDQSGDVLLVDDAELLDDEG